MNDYEIVCHCGDHITLTKNSPNTYSGMCLGCGLRYTLAIEDL